MQTEFKYIAYIDDKAFFQVHFKGVNLHFMMLSQKTKELHVYTPMDKTI